MNTIEILIYLNTLVLAVYSLYCAMGRRGVILHAAGSFALTAMFGLTVQMAVQA